MTAPGRRDARAEAAPDAEISRAVAVGVEDLAAVKDDVVAFEPRGRPEVGDRRSGVRFGHRRRDDRLTGEELREDGLFQRFVAEERDLLDRAEVARLKHVPRVGADLRDLHDGDHAVHERCPLSALLLGEAHAHKSVFRQDLRVLPGIRPPRSRFPGECLGGKML